jgi:hypothetical protein
MFFTYNDQHEGRQHTTRIDGIAAALQAMGKRLDMRVV